MIISTRKEWYFIKVSKNLARSKNNFVTSSK